MLPYPQALANGISGPPVESRHGLTDHHHERRALAVGVPEDPPTAYGNAERREVIRGHDLHVEHRVGGGLFRGLPVGRKLAVPPPQSSTGSADHGTGAPP